MLNAVLELFLSKYYYVSIVSGRHAEDDRRLFFALSNIFLIPEYVAKELYALVHNAEVENISTVSDYNLLSRLNQYGDIANLSANMSEEISDIVCIKGSVLLSLEKTPFARPAVIKQVIYSAVTAAVNSGSVDMLAACGILKCEGIFFEKHAKSGIRCLKKAAEWLDITAMLALMRYDPSSRGLNLTRLRAIAYMTPYEPVIDKVIAAYGDKGGADISAERLLNRAFESGILKREQYDAKIARILASDIISQKDKQHLVFMSNREHISAVSNLPLKFGKEGRGTFSCGQFKAPFGDSDGQKISSALANVNCCSSGCYRPLCVVSDSKYMLKAYAEAIVRYLGSAHTERIDVSSLTPYDCEPSANNIFVRNIDEDKPNCCMPIICGNVDSSAIAAVNNFASTEKRSRFNIANLGVTLNLSGVLVVCLCDKRNAPALKGAFQVIELSIPDRDTRRSIICEIVKNRGAAYGLKSVSVSRDLGEYLSDYSIDQIETAIDKAIRLCGKRAKRLTVTAAIVAPYIANSARVSIGFGGNTNENT